MATKKKKESKSKKTATKSSAKKNEKAAVKKKPPAKKGEKATGSKKKVLKKSTAGAKKTRKTSLRKKKSPTKTPRSTVKKATLKTKEKPTSKTKKSTHSVPSLSIVIPIYNEEGIVSASIADLCEKLKNEPDFDRSFEIILSENGSTDNTIPIVEEIMKSNPHVRLISVGEPNYGLAMRKGILLARADLVICDEIDLCDVDFYIRAIEEIEKNGFDLVVGSKALDTSRDKRPLYRKAATFTLNSMLRVFLGFKGTDTHGLKALRKSRLLEVVDRCVVEKDLFASEFVIRTSRMGFRSKEIPVTIAEKRPPSINLINRVPGVLKNLGQLFWVIRVKHR